MTRLELGYDQWAELRPADCIPHKLTMKYRKVFYRVAAAGAGVDQTLSDEEKATAAGKAMIEGGGLDAMDDLANVLVLSVVKEWSYGEVTLDVLEDVPTAALKKITDECVDGGYVEMLQPDFGRSPEPDSPTAPYAL